MSESRNNSAIVLCLKTKRRKRAFAWKQKEPEEWLFLGLILVALIIEPVAEPFQRNSYGSGESLLLFFGRIRALIIEGLHHRYLLGREWRIDPDAKLGQHFLGRQLGEKRYMQTSFNHEGVERLIATWSLEEISNHGRTKWLQGCLSYNE